MRKAILNRATSAPSSGKAKRHPIWQAWETAKASPGSELIIEAVDKKDDPRPVWIAAWGGMNTVAQALWTVTHTRSPKDIERFVRKIRIYDVLGQDDAGAWIAQNYPGILYLRNKAVYGWAPSDEWLRDNIQSHKPLGDYYPDRKWATEGDSPSFLHVYANGLNVPEEITFGGWGGRFSDIPVENIRGMKFIAQSGKDESLYDPYRMYACAAEGGNSIKRWEREIWNDFAARMAWTATDEYSAVNHHPVAIVDGHDDMNCIYKKDEGRPRYGIRRFRILRPRWESAGFPLGNLCRTQYV